MQALTQALKLSGKIRQLKVQSKTVAADREKKMQGDMLVIFDCDGVLVDSEAICSRVEFRALRRLGCLLSLDEYLEVSLGRSDEDFLWNSIASEWGVTLPGGFGEDLRRETDQALRAELSPVEGIKDVLPMIPCEKCIASGASPERLELTLGITGLAEEFAGKCFSGSMVERGKPAPDVFLFAAEQMGFEPGRCIVVEDSVNGVKAAVSAGMTVLGFTGASHCRPGLGARLESLGCRKAFSDLRELPSLIERNSGL